MSTVAFPYSDLAEAERTARQVAQSLGRCRPEQLAAWLGHSKLNSGAFRNKVVAAKLFGLLVGGRNILTLTDLGRDIVDGATIRQARVEAFLTVPLYRAIFESHRGKSIGGRLGLDLQMVQGGVTRTQVKAARQVFVRSARHAGFFEAGENQLVLPRGTVFPAASADPANGRAAPGNRYPKVVEAILEQAPWNSSWTPAEFDEWAGLLVQAARVHFRIPQGKSGRPDQPIGDSVARPEPAAE